MRKKFSQYIEKQVLFTQDDKLLLAISGGVDSSVLGYLLHQAGYDFALAHCNFGLRAEESDEDQAFVQSLAAQWSVPCFSISFQTHEEKKAGESVQMTARRLRYDWLEDIRAQNGYQYILTAHHIDDSIETFLINFIRGTGLQGLAGIQPLVGNMRRPLLFANRNQIEAYASEQQISFREDSSNKTDKYRRNQLRHHVLPALYAINPSLADVARRNFSQLTQSQALIEQAAKEWKAKIWSTDEQGRPVLDRARLQELSFGPLLLHHWLTPYSFNPEEIRQALEAKPSTILNSPTHSLLVEHSEIILAVHAEEEHSMPISVARSAEEIDLGQQRFIRIKKGTPPLKDLKTPPSVIRVPAEALVYPLSIRYWEAGDWFCPFGMKGQRQKIQDFFVNQKINQLDRQEVFLIINGNREIIWVVNQRLDDRYKIVDRQAPFVEFEFVY